MAKKYQPQYKDSNGVLQDLDLCAVYDGNGNEITNYYVNTVSEQSVNGLKTFNDNIEVADTIFSTTNALAFSSNDGDFCYMGFESGTGSYMTLPGHLIIYSDDDTEDDRRPVSNFGVADVDAFFYSTGIYVTTNGEDDDYKYSFPKKSGTFGLAIEIVDLTNL